MLSPWEDRKLAMACAQSYDEYTFEHGDVQVLQAEIDGDTVFVFRGTDDLRDVLSDLRAWPTRHPEIGVVHKGFLRGVQAVWPQLVERLPEGPYHLSGHSKGGAEALLAGALAARLGPHPPKSIITFGAPRCGFAKLGRVLRNIPVRQYRNGVDAVPTHPWPLWGYRHPRDLIKIGPPAHRIRDHRMRRYLSSLLIEEPGYI